MYIFYINCLFIVLKKQKSVSILAYFKRKMIFLQKNTAHIERCMLNYSYICPVTENPLQT